MKDLHYFLGREVTRTPVGIMISQPHHILNLLYMFGMSDYKSMATPLYHNLKHKHMDWTKWVLWYVSGIMGCNILYKSANPRSTSDFVFSLVNWAISWSSKTQLIVVAQSTEVEYKGATMRACEAVWFKRILKDLVAPIKDFIPLYNNNMSITYIARNPVFQAHTNHIQVHYHSIRDRIQARYVGIQHINTNL